MRQGFEKEVLAKADFLVGSADILSGMSGLPAMRIFDERVAAFLNALSGEILKSDDAKRYSDAVTFAFWCRKSNLHTLKSRYDSGRLGRGVAFHIAPSNVPLNFAYSMAAGMLAGNANIVRLPSKDFWQTNLICKTIAKMLGCKDYSDIGNRLCLVRYSYNKKITDAFSLICNSRVIWGGDATVEEIRKSPLPSRANEITFPERYSFCVINADNYLSKYDAEKTARDFYNDTYLTDQNACTSPRIVVWFGTQRKKAKELFWAALGELLVEYELHPIQTMNKLSTFCRFAANAKCLLSKADDFKLMRVAVNTLDDDVLNNLENSGYFYEHDANSLDEIIPLCGSRCQTLSYIGFDAEELHEFVLNNAPAGVDRIVPTGKTMDFSLVWDGHDLIRELSRVVDVCQATCPLDVR